MGLTNYRFTYRPFEYQKCYDFYRSAQLVHWTKDEINLGQDIQDWNMNLTETEKNVIGGILKGFTQMEILVGDYWRKVAEWFPKPEVAMMSTSFSYFESIHMDNYAMINEQLQLDDFSAFLYDESTKKKLDYFLDRPNITEIKDIASSLAIFSAFAEGCLLFSSFAVLLSFQRENLMKGVGQIVSFSVRDENCFTEDVEILTEKGFKKFKDLKLTDKVAQFDNYNITFVNPTNFISKEVQEEIITLKGESLASNLTKNHDLLLVDKKGNFFKRKSEDFKQNTIHSFPVTGQLKNQFNTSLSNYERLKIAIQADGHLLQWTNKKGDSLRRGKKGGYNVSISLKKPEKIDNLKNILSSLNLDYDIKIKKDGKNLFNIKMNLDNHKSLNWVYEKSDLSLNWCNEFIEEIVKWDGHVRKDTSGFIYCSTDKSCIDAVQYVAILAGYRTKIIKTEDKRKNSYKTYYRLSIHSKNKKTVTCNSVKKSTSIYSGNVYCVSVPSGNIVTRCDDKVFITGNCHSEGGIYLFNTLCEENKGLKEMCYDDIRNAAIITYQLEESFLNNLFKEEDIRTLTKDDLLEFVKYRINLKLNQMGYTNLFTTDKDALERMSWFSSLTSAREFGDFFAVRVSEYSQRKVSADDMF